MVLKIEKLYLSIALFILIIVIYMKLTGVDMRKW